MLIAAERRGEAATHIPDMKSIWDVQMYSHVTANSQSNARNVIGSSRVSPKACSRRKGNRHGSRAGFEGWGRVRDGCAEDVGLGMRAQWFKKAYVTSNDKEKMIKKHR